MGEAFDEPRKRPTAKDSLLHRFETIAARLIAAASKGERDPVRDVQRWLADDTRQRLGHSVGGFFHS